MNLYNIQQEHLSLIAIIEDGGGEVTEELEQALVLSKESFMEKATSIGYVLKRLEDTDMIIKKEIDRLKGLKERNTKGYEYLKERIKEAMIQFDVEKIKTETLTLSLRKSEKVKILDEKLIEAEYYKPPAPRELDITKIKNAIKEGVNVFGAEIEKNKTLQIK